MNYLDTPCTHPACQNLIPASNTWLGRPKRFCSNACRQSFYRWVKNGYEHVRFSYRYKTQPVTVPVPVETPLNPSLTLQNYPPQTLQNPQRDDRSATPVWQQVDWTDSDGWVL